MKQFHSLLFTFLIFSANAQSIDTLCLVHDTLPEISGMNVSTSGTIWAHNDSGDDPVLYEIDTNGNLLRSVVIRHAVNVDWEDITKDDQGNYFIGDFGNNLQKRKDLTIYKIPSPEINMDDTLFADSLVYTYPDQTAFPPSIQDWNYDCESVIYFDDHLYVFSKNWGPSPITTMYQIQDSLGSFTSKIAGTFNTGGFITAATLSPDETTLVLLSQDYLWVFYDFTAPDFFSGESMKFEFEETQKEACSFLNDSILYFADEKDSVNYIYQINISSLLDTVQQTTALSNMVSLPSIIIQGNKLIITGIIDRMKIELFDLLGRRIYQMNSSAPEAAISLNDLSTGYYLLSLNGRQASTSQLIYLNTQY